MSDIYKAFITAVSRDLALTPNDVAFECIAATMNLPAMSKYVNGTPPACRFDMPKVTYNAKLETELAVITAELATRNTELATRNTELGALQGRILALHDEISVLLAENTDLKNTLKATTPKVTTPKVTTPKATTPKAGGLAAEGSLKALAINGIETSAHSWRAGAMYMLGLLTDAGQKGAVPPGWFRDEAGDRTTPLPSGDHAFNNLSVYESEMRIRTVAEVLGHNVTLRIVRADGTIHDYDL
jgi:hypothetical protein